MFFRFNRRYNFLDVADDFAHLRRIHPNGDLEFEFFYNIKPHDAVANEALTVNVSVLSRTIKVKPILENTQLGFINTRALINNVLQQMPNAKSAIKQQQDYTVASRNSDISTKINNEIIPQLRAKIPARNIQQLVKPILTLMPSSDVKEGADIKPLLTQIAHAFTTDITTVNSASINENPTRLMHDLIARQGIDPTHIFDLTDRSVASVDALGGILRPSNAIEIETSPSTRLLNYHIFPPETHNRPTYTSQVSDDTVVQVLTYEPQTTVEIALTLIIPRSALTQDGSDNSHFFVKFDLINGRSRVAVDSVSKSLDVARHMQLYYTPRRPPVVKLTKSEVSTRANLEIKQIDPGATSVQIYKKQFFRAVTDVDSYSLIGTYDVKRNEQSLLVQVDSPQNSPILYRVVPMGNQGTQGYEFTNVVIRPSRYRQIKSLALSVIPVDIGIKIEARQIPQHVVSIEFKVRNLTTFETSYRNVGGTVSLINDTVRTSDYLTIVDKDVNPNNIYEYVARLVYESGTSELAGTASIEFLQPSPGKVDTKIDDLIVDQTGDLNVTFSISTTIIDNNIDVVKRLLQQQDIYDQFKGDVDKEREFLKNLIAHNIQRVDLTTGIREDFGVVTADQFSDVDLRKNQAIQPLKLGHRYRYEVSALLREPETMFDSLNKKKVDPVTKKTYTFSPAKFLHPIALTQGTLVSAAGLKTRFAKEPMAHGAIGFMQSVDVSFDDEPARVVDASASRFDKFLNIITWKVQGSLSAVDHFIIMKDVHGVRTLVGKAHSEFTYGNCQYLHPVSRRDEGSFNYVIVPVFNTYKTGTQVATNAVIVEQFNNGLPAR